VAGVEGRKYPPRPEHDPPCAVSVVNEIVGVWAWRCKVAVIFNFWVSGARFLWGERVGYP